VVNPRLIEKSGSSWREEGCLSLPTILVDVERAKSIVVEAQNEFGHPVLLKETGLVATIIQHEMDHLEGILILDHGSPKPLEEGA
jgi:peptide deformylase